MTEIKVTLSQPWEYVRALEAARACDLDDSTLMHLDALRGMVQDQLPKPVVAEPMEFGSVVKAKYWNGRGELRWCRTYSVLVDEPWCTGNHMGSWAEVIEEASDVEVLRVGIGPDPLAQWETELLGLQERREVAAAVLAAMDVDQYLIDAVSNARPR